MSLTLTRGETMAVQGEEHGPTTTPPPGASPVGDWSPMSYEDGKYVSELAPGTYHA